MNACKHRQKQTGVGLLLFLLLVFGIGTMLALSARSSTQARLAQEQKTQLALQLAKEALIAWSTSRSALGASGYPGQLPCPEDTSQIGTDKEGLAQTTTSCASLVGRLPWRTLGLDNIKDASGEPLWYILSPNFRPVPAGTYGIPPGQLQLDGVPNSAAAVVLAPGPPLSGQIRGTISASTPPISANYLDLGNASGTSLQSNGPTDTFNDRVVTITSNDLFLAVRRRVLTEIRGDWGVNYGLRRYYNDNSNKFPPVGTPLNTLLYESQTLTWLNKSNWFSLVTYTYYPPANPRLSVGGLSIDVTPCVAFPCP